MCTMYSSLTDAMHKFTIYSYKYKSVLYTTEHCTVYSVHCTLYTIQCTVVPAQVSCAATYKGTAQIRYFNAHFYQLALVLNIYLLVYTDIL